MAEGVTNPSKTPVALAGEKVRAMTFASEMNDLPARPVTGRLSLRWLEVWQDWDYDVDGVQVDPETIEVLGEK